MSDVDDTDEYEVEQAAEVRSDYGTARPPGLTRASDASADQNQVAMETGPAPRLGLLHQEKTPAESEASVVQRGELTSPEERAMQSERESISLTGRETTAAAERETIADHWILAAEAAAVMSEDPKANESTCCPGDYTVRFNGCSENRVCTVRLFSLVFPAFSVCCSLKAFV